MVMGKEEGRRKKEEGRRKYITFLNYLKYSSLAPRSP